MFPNFSRNQVQLISFVLFHAGAISILAGGWSNEFMRAGGISLMAGSIWFVMMSESVLLTKVQNEMHRVLEKLSIKRESEIEELLYFLRDAKLRRDPWSSIDAATAHIEKLPFPAYIITPELRVHKINKSWTDTLGWDESVCGKSAIPLQCPEHWGEISIKLAAASDNKEWMHFSRYCFMSTNGKEIPGTVAIFIFPDLTGCGAVFYPDYLSIIQE